MLTTLFKRKVHISDAGTKSYNNDAKIYLKSKEAHRNFSPDTPQYGYREVINYSILKV